jgi:D-aminoacyl-tRNA deacylase
MRALVQRVSKASVLAEGRETGRIHTGLVVLLGVETADTLEDVDWLANKLVQLRIFNDAEGKMNLSLKDVEGEVMLVSQFTLHASTKKGNRPSYIRAAPPEHAMPMYEAMKARLETLTGKPVATGIFGAYMEVSLVNDGPVTIWIDTRQKE